MLITPHVPSQIVFDSDLQQRETEKLRENSEGKKKGGRGGVSVQGLKIEHKEEKHQEVTKGITLLERSADLQ